MQYFLCAVPKKLKNNYEIGIISHKWGVEEKYYKKIKRVQEHDRLIFLVGNYFKSIHEITTTCQKESNILWPPKNGDIFPYRINISDPLIKGNVDISIIAKKLDFIKQIKTEKINTQRTLAVQGSKGVFNDKLTDNDIICIESSMRKGNEKYTIFSEPDQIKNNINRDELLLKFCKKDIFDNVENKLNKIGLVLYHDKNIGKSGREFVVNNEEIDFLCIDQNNNFTVIIFNVGIATQNSLLRVLRCMSLIRQNFADKKDVKGIILTEKTDKVFEEIVKEVSSVRIVHYRFVFEDL
ncbi:MAG: hypothetical protein ACOY4F_10335 [Thermodesulfobacteriota bacterium]